MRSKLNKRSLLLVSALFLALLSHAQVTTDPVVVTESDEVKVFFDASQGNRGLMGHTGDVYAHTGVVTDQSANGSEWRYAPAWGDNQAKYKLVSLGNNRWQLTITPDIHTYYGVPKSEKVLKLAFVFRSEDCKKEGKGEGNTDIFVTLNQETFIPGDPEQKIRPEGLADGITYIDAQTVALSLYAPGKNHVHLLGDFNEWKKDNRWQLYQDGDYWWTTVGDLEAGKEYAFQYLIDNQFKVADAYAEKILDPQYDGDIPASVYPNLPAYPKQTEGIVSVLQMAKAANVWSATGFDRQSQQLAEPQDIRYTWTVTDFEPVQGEQLVIYELLVRDFTEDGTIAAATEKLDYLKAMGINAVELMPIQEFDGNDSWGYNPSFFFAPDKAYGTPDDYKYFIDEAHRRGMAVILDVVLNHATGTHPFARMYWNAETNQPAADNPWFNVTEPHPYGFFCDFNHEFAGTRVFFKRMLSHWLTEYRVDGFRLDFTKGLTQQSSTEATASNYDASRIAILKDYHSHIQSINPEAYTILEHFCENKEEKELADAGMFLWNNLNNAYCQTAMGYKENSSLAGGNALSRGWTEHRLITYQESHDEERTAYKAKTWGIASIKDNEQTRMKQAILNAAFLLCTPGPKMVWQFGELGYDHSIDENGRTGRKPIRWDYLENESRKTLYESYSLLTKLRHTHPTLFASPKTVVMQTGTSDWDGGRQIVLQEGDRALVLVGNFTDKAISATVDFPLTGAWSDYFSDAAYVLQISAENKTQNISVPAHAFSLYVRHTDGSANDPVTVESQGRIYLQGTTLCVESLDAIAQISLYTFDGTLRKTIQTTASSQTVVSTSIGYVASASEISNMAGRNSSVYTMDVSGMAKGLYLATARTLSGQVFSQKLRIR